MFIIEIFFVHKFYEYMIDNFQCEIALVNTRGPGNNGNEGELHIP